jgi:hypothetical protein
VTWLIDHSTSHQLLWNIDSFELRNPPLRQAAKRSSRFDLLNLLNSQTEGEKKSPHQIKIEGFFTFIENAELLQFHSGIK